jgi:hypothetical protein
VQSVQLYDSPINIDNDEKRLQDVNKTIVISHKRLLKESEFDKNDILKTTKLQVFNQSLAQDEIRMKRKELVNLQAKVKKSKQVSTFNLSLDLSWLLLFTQNEKDDKIKYQQLFTTTSCILTNIIQNPVREHCSSARRHFQQHWLIQL